MMPTYDYPVDIPVDKMKIRREIDVVKYHKQKLIWHIQQTKSVKQRNLARKGIVAADSRLLALRFVRDEMASKRR